MKFVRLFSAFALYLVLLSLVWLVYVHYVRVDVVFYAAMGAAAIALLVHAILTFLTPLLRSFNTFEKAQHLLSCALLGYIMAISVPTVIDRSLSFYILEKLAQRGGGIQQARFNDVFTKEYMFEHRLVDVRLTEQSESGTIEFRNGCVRLTPKGERIVAFSRFFRQNLLPKHRLLMGEYTDQLTNPFARSIASPDYLCQ